MAYIGEYWMARENIIKRSNWNWFWKSAVFTACCQPVIISHEQLMQPDKDLLKNNYPMQCRRAYFLMLNKCLTLAAAADEDLKRFEPTEQIPSVLTRIPTQMKSSPAEVYAAPLHYFIRRWNTNIKNPKEERIDSSVFMCVLQLAAPFLNFCHATDTSVFGVGKASLAQHQHL